MHLNKEVYFWIAFGKSSHSASVGEQFAGNRISCSPQFPFGKLSNMRNFQFRNIRSHHSQISAVSPIISTILLIGICTVFASVMFVWVSGLVLQSGYVPAGELAIMERNNTTSNVTYTILIKVLRPGTAPQDIKCYITDSFGIVKAVFDFPTEKGSFTVSLNGTKSGNITWMDENGNGNVSPGDYIVLSIDATAVDDRELLREYSFCLRHAPTGGNLIAEVGLT